MSIKLDTSSRQNAGQDPVLHHMPVELQFEGDAKIAEYFTTGIRRDVHNTDVQTASFRGRPLHGSKVAAPEGYTGLILTELHKPFNEEEEREFKITHEFKEYTSWNLDCPPSINDKVQQALQWIKLSTAIHNPVVDESSPKSDTSR